MTTPTTSTFDSEFGRRLADARRSAGMSQRALADRLGEHGLSLDSAALSRIETGSRAPKLEEAVILSEVLNVALTRLVPTGADAEQLGRARYSALRQLDDALYKMTGVAGSLEFLASCVNSAPDAAREAFGGRDGDEYDWEAWAIEQVRELASSPERRVAPSTVELADAIRRVLASYVDAIVPHAREELHDNPSVSELDEALAPSMRQFAEKHFVNALASASTDDASDSRDRRTESSDDGKHQTTT